MWRLLDYTCCIDALKEELVTNQLSLTIQPNDDAPVWIILSDSPVQQNTQTFLTQTTEEEAQTDRQQINQPLSAVATSSTPIAPASVIIGGNAQFTSLSHRTPPQTHLPTERRAVHRLHTDNNHYIQTYNAYLTAMAEAAPAVSLVPGNTVEHWDEARLHTELLNILNYQAPDYCDDVGDDHGRYIHDSSILSKIFFLQPCCPQEKDNTLTDHQYQQTITFMQMQNRPGRNMQGQNTGTIFIGMKHDQLCHLSLLLILMSYSAFVSCYPI